MFFISWAAHLFWPKLIVTSHCEQLNLGSKSKYVIILSFKNAKIEMISTRTCNKKYSIYTFVP